MTSLNAARLMPGLVLLALLLVSRTYAHDSAEDTLVWVAMKQASLGIKEAINKAKVEQPGRIIKFEADDEDGKLVYEFKLLDNKLENEHELKIDANSGKVLSHEREPAEKWMKRLQSQDFFKTTLNMSEAIDAANKIKPGMVIEAKMKIKMGVQIYVMDIISEGRRLQVLIDARSGEVIPAVRR
ncbi:PepSY domain-containing protein [Endozoicomonadaceae bacterium StTr2]